MRRRLTGGAIERIGTWKSAKTLKGGVVAVGVMTNDIARDFDRAIGIIESRCAMARGLVMDHNGPD